MLMAGAAALSGCGSSNESAPGVSVAGQHSAEWVLQSHPVEALQSQNQACTSCHGTDFRGGISKASCFQCHPAGPPLAQPRCTSCHGNPPDGAFYPNQANAHTAHSTAATGTDCTPCHFGFGSGTLSHLTESRNPAAPADVAFNPVYNARTGPAAYNAAGSTCTNVSCHGGQATPPWAGGVIDVLNQCQSCHQLATAVPSAGGLPQPQFNSFFSGQHKFHVQTVGMPCNDCHDMNSAAAGANQGAVNHFRFLDTPAMEGPARTTMRGALVFDAVPAIPTCNPGATPAGFSVGVCHATRAWVQQVLP